jgi:YjbE family integral membrane protein
MSVDPDFIVRFLSITLINVALSGDNVIVIGMAAASLPRTERRLAIVGGGFLAVVLRIGLTLAAAMLLQIPLLTAIGGLILFWVAWGLLKADVDEEHRPQAGSHSLRRAIWLIVVADVTMSLDNVIAVAGTAGGNLVLLVAGLLISMPLLLVAGGAVSMLIDRFRWLVYLGAAAICFAGARMLLDSEPLRSDLRLAPPAVLVASLLLAAALPLCFRWLRGRGGMLAG